MTKCRYFFFCKTYPSVDAVTTATLPTKRRQTMSDLLVLLLLLLRWIFIFFNAIGNKICDLLLMSEPKQPLRIADSDIFLNRLVMVTFVYLRREKKNSLSITTLLLYYICVYVRQRRTKARCTKRMYNYEWMVCEQWQQNNGVCFDTDISVFVSFIIPIAIDWSDSVRMWRMISLFETTINIQLLICINAR